MNVFFVSTSFQLTSAAEAAFQLELGGPRVLFVLDRDPLFQILPRYQHLFDEVVQLPAKAMTANGIFRWLRPLKAVAQFAKRRPKAKTVFLGAYNVPTISMANYFSFESAVLLDDGTATLTVPTTRQARRGTTLKDLARVALVGSSGNLDCPIDYFSMFELNSVRAPDRVTRNEFRFHRERFPARVAQRPALFVGQPLLELGLLSESTVSRGLAAFRAVSDGPCAYALHPAETKVDMVRAAGFEPVRFDRSIELELLENGFPQRVGSFFSTALFSLNATRPGSVELVAMQPSPSAWKSAAAARAHDVYYDALIRVGVPVVSLS